MQRLVENASKVGQQIHRKAEAGGLNRMNKRTRAKKMRSKAKRLSRIFFGTAGMAEDNMAHFPRKGALDHRKGKKAVIGDDVKWPAILCVNRSDSITILAEQRHNIPFI